MPTMQYPKQTTIPVTSSAANTGCQTVDQHCDRACTCRRSAADSTPHSPGAGGSPKVDDSAVNTAVTSPPGLHYNSSQNQKSDPFSSTESLSTEVQNQILTQQVSQLEREKHDAFRQVKEVTKMNTRWQKYDKEREAVVVDLTLKCRCSEEKVHHQERKIHKQQQRIEELELLWTDARVRAAERKAELDRVQRELQSRIESLELGLRQSEAKMREASKTLKNVEKQNARHDTEVEKKRHAEKDRDLFHMSKRVVDLKEKVQHLEQQLTAMQKQMDEQADLYTQQISIYLDDFKHEKRDKDRIQKENEDLKKRLKAAEDFASSLRVEITKYENQQQGMAQRRQQPVHKYYTNIYEEPLSHSWDDGGFTLPSEVVRDDVPYDEINENGARLNRAHLDHARGAAGPVPIEPPPQYDDKSVLGHVIYPKHVRGPEHINGITHVTDLVLH